MSPATRSLERSCRQSGSSSECASSGMLLFPCYPCDPWLKLPPYCPCDPWLAPTHLARRARAGDVAPVGGRPPRLVRLRFRRSLGFRGGQKGVSWRLRCFRGGRGLGPRRARLLWSFSRQQCLYSCDPFRSGKVRCGPVVAGSCQASCTSVPYRRSRVIRAIRGPRCSVPACGGADSV